MCYPFAPLSPAVFLFVSSCSPPFCTCHTAFHVRAKKSQVSHSSERHCIQSPRRRALVESLTHAWSLQRKSNPVAVHSVGRNRSALIETHSSRGHLCLFSNWYAIKKHWEACCAAFFKQVRPVASETADNSRFWQAFSAQCARFDVGIFLVYELRCSPKAKSICRTSPTRNFTSICSL